MIVAFLDLLGFSQLLERNQEVALDNLYNFNEVIRTKITDNMAHPYTESKGNLREFAQNTAVTSFKHMISFSDSLVLGADDVETFIKQLMNFVATVYIYNSSPFKQPFDDISQVKSDTWLTCEIDANLNSTYRHHGAFPILFRGGLSFGNDAYFFDEFRIANGRCDKVAYNITGKTYLKAVKLEKTGKGPRLFCDKSVVDALEDKSIVRIVCPDKDIFEIVWTIGACEATRSSNDKWSNVTNCIYDRLLPSAINLYKYYRSDHFMEDQYKGLVDIVCHGIIKYAQEKCDKADDAIREINRYNELHSVDLRYDKNVLSSFMA